MAAEAISERGSVGREESPRDDLEAPAVVVDLDGDHSGSQDVGGGRIAGEEDDGSATDGSFVMVNNDSDDPGDGDLDHEDVGEKGAPRVTNVGSVEEGDAGGDREGKGREGVEMGSRAENGHDRKPEEDVDLDTRSAAEAGENGKPDAASVKADVRQEIEPDVEELEVPKITIEEANLVAEEEVSATEVKVVTTDSRDLADGEVVLTKEEMGAAVQGSSNIEEEELVKEKLNTVVAGAGLDEEAELPVQEEEEEEQNSGPKTGSLADQAVASTEMKVVPEEEEEENSGPKAGSLADQGVASTETNVVPEEEEEEQNSGPKTGSLADQGVASTEMNVVLLESDLQQGTSEAELPPQLVQESITAPENLIHIAEQDSAVAAVEEKQHACVSGVESVEGDQHTGISAVESGQSDMDPSLLVEEKPQGEPVLVDEKPEIEPILVEEKPEAKPVAIEEKPVEADPIVVEEKIVEPDPILVEEEPVEADPIVVEEEPVVADHILVEEEPVVADHDLVEEEPVVADPILVEEEPVVADHNLVEEEPVVADPILVEEEPVVADPILVEEETEAEPVIVEEKPEEENIAVGETQGVELVVVEEKPEAEPVLVEEKYEDESAVAKAIDLVEIESVPNEHENQQSGTVVNVVADQVKVQERKEMDAVASDGQVNGKFELVEIEENQEKADNTVLDAHDQVEPNLAIEIEGKALPCVEVVTVNGGEEIKTEDSKKAEAVIMEIFEKQEPQPFITSNNEYIESENIEVEEEEKHPSAITEEINEHSDSMSRESVEHTDVEPVVHVLLKHGSEVVASETSVVEEKREIEANESFDMLDGLEATAEISGESMVAPLEEDTSAKKDDEDEPLCVEVEPSAEVHTPLEEDTSEVTAEVSGESMVTPLEEDTSAKKDDEDEPSCVEVEPSAEVQTPLEEDTSEVTAEVSGESMVTPLDEDTSAKKDDEDEPSCVEVEPSAEVHTPLEEPSSSAVDGDKLESLKRQPCYIIRVPKFGDDELAAKLQHARVQLDQKTQSRDSIRAEIRKKKATHNEFREMLNAAKVEEEAARSVVTAKRKEIDSMLLMLNKMKSASSIDEINDKIHKLGHILQHESNTLPQEKQYINDIKKLKQQRDQLSSNIGTQAEIEEAFERKDQIEEQFKTLKKELESLRTDQQRAENNVKSARNTCNDEFQLLRVLQEQFKAADDLRQEAYVHLQNLRKESSERNKYFSMYKDDQQAALMYASSGDREGLQCHCSKQVEKIMELWNNNDEFRKQYITSNMYSTLRRLRTLDGRSLGPGEESPILYSAVDRNSSSISLPSTNISTPPSALAAEVKEKISDAQDVQMGQTAKSAKPQKSTPSRIETTKATVLKKEVIEEVEEIKATKPTKEEEELARKQEILVRQEEELRKEREAAELKERCRIEQRQKAREAEERKRRNAEKAQARAEYKARKDAELQEKKRAKKEKKLASADTRNGSTEGDSNAVADVAPFETAKELESSVSTVTKRSNKPKASIKQIHKVQPLPLPLRNRAKRKTQKWLWVLFSIIFIIAVFLAGNYVSHLNLPKFNY